MGLIKEECVFDKFSTWEEDDMFGKKKIIKPKVTYDSSEWKAVLRCSICNGEQVAGFKNRHTGEFKEIALIRNSKELDQFWEIYSLESIAKEY